MNKKYSTNKNRDIHLSIISHGQWPMIINLLNDLSKIKSCSRIGISITININEVYNFIPNIFPFPIEIIKNKYPKGFGANHNFAFKKSYNKLQYKYFAVINPDIRINEDVFSPLINRLDEKNESRSSSKQIGLIAPEIKNNKNKREDNARKIPTPFKILSKFFGQKTRWSNESKKHYQPDWVAGMFMLFKKEVFKQIEGFNPSYFLYYEDVDLCSRLWIKNYSIEVDPCIYVIHNAQRSSHKNLKYLKWHISSMLRFFLSKTYRKAKKIHKNRT